MAEKEKHHAQSAKHSEAHRAKKNANAQKAVIVLALVFLAIVAYDFYLAYSSNAIVSERLAAATEAARPANLQITKILAQSCADCFDVSVVDNALVQLNVKTSVNSIDYASTEAKQLISKYNITKVPTMLITGEIDKAAISFWSQIGTSESDGTLVLRYGAPFVNPSTGTEFGKVQLTEISDRSCGSCYNVSIHENILNGFGVAFSGINVYDMNSSEGARLVSLYNITKVPTMLMSPDAKYYESLQGIWKQVGTIEKDGWYVFRDMNAVRGIVYFDLSLNKTVNATAQ